MTEYENYTWRRIETHRWRKRWGRGRLRQYLEALRCRLQGHHWHPWTFDWPYDVPEYWEDVGEEPRDPRPDEPLTWIRGCDRGCGTIQGAQNVTLLQAGVLPGRVYGLYENPIRRHFT